MPTAFDWRVGVLGGKPLFVCQYMMAKKHWQIVKHRADGKPLEGGAPAPCRSARRRRRSSTSACAPRS